MMERIWEWFYRCDCAASVGTARWPARLAARAMRRYLRYADRRAR